MKMKLKILKTLWNILYKNNGNIFWQKNTVNKNSDARRTKQNRLMLVSNSAVVRINHGLLKIKTKLIMNKIRDQNSIK